MLEVIVWKHKIVDFAIVSGKFVVEILQRHVEELLGLAVMDSRFSESFSLQALFAALLM
ncbi:MAG TPA: hypothetical protein PKM59_13625 [Thermodesulfobacteriota bacterium]|nr:hypothetical protein [Thermodesulfobacteriota bacterium]